MFQDKIEKKKEIEVFGQQRNLKFLKVLRETNE